MPTKNSAPEKPEGAATIRTFARFQETLDSFAQKVEDPQGFKFLLIIGKGGKGKTECVKAALEHCGYAQNSQESGYGYANGKMTPIELYKFLYEYRDFPIVLDDINALMSSKEAPSLIQAATDTRLPRTVSFRSNHASIGYDEGQTPPTFQTTSPIVIIANEWASTNHVIKAIETRAYSIYFNPSNEEVHSSYVPTWFGKNEGDKEIYDFIGSWIESIPNLHCRSYILGRQLRYNRPQSWQEELESVLIPDHLFTETLALRLLNDDSYASDLERIEEFKKRGGGSAITFKRIKQSLGLSRQYRQTFGRDGRKERHEQASMGYSDTSADFLNVSPGKEGGFV